MLQSDPSGLGAGYGYGDEPRERGSRRRKVYGYLKAANELRQSYVAQHAQRRDDDDEQGVPGAFPDVEVVRSGDEEMVIFPSYARHHVKKQPRLGHQQMPGTREDIGGEGAGDADYWKRQWEKYEDDNAIVDVDVRGWIYSPHRGPVSRKNRLLIAVARRLSGIPAPAPSENNSRSSSRASTHRERFDDRSSRHEAEQAAKTAESIAQRGEAEADAAWRGGYSEEPSRDSDRASVYSSRSVSPDSQKEPIPGKIPHPLTNTSLASVQSTDSFTNRKSWTQPENMTREELMAANTHLMARLKPFMSIPLTDTPITVFFFNENQSQSRTVNTDDSGHFTIRASLDFMPTQVRVLASEKLSATEEVRITDANGISMISDIDDTIKHSAISNGAKEIFRNTFIRDLSDLTVPGVREWYSKMSEMGVQLHYVSNSPWQLYPLLQSYFSLAGLPPGSFHLKQYSGMLQGIFEPAAERKKGSLERIMRDFPTRKFILVGDSGEADLELYTDIVVSNPGRVLAVFIRDVTTPERKHHHQQQQFFDRSTAHLESKQSSRSGSDTPSDKSRLSNPGLPPRKRLERSQTAKANADPPMGTLINLDDEPPQQSNDAKAASMVDLLELDQPRTINRRSPAPIRPNKPLGLRSVSKEDSRPNLPDPVPRKAAPPLPIKPRSLSNAKRMDPTISVAPSQRTSPTSKQHQVPTDPKRNPKPEEQSYTTAVRNKVATAYSSIPSARDYWNGESDAASSDSTPDGRRSMKSAHPPPRPPPRRTISSYPPAAAHYASNRLSWNAPTGDQANNSNASSSSANVYGGPAPTLNKKEEVWRRRWTRAQDIMASKKVVLRSWSVGEDVMDESVRLVQKEMHRINHEKK